MSKLLQNLSAQNSSLLIMTSPSVSGKACRDNCSREEYFTGTKQKPGILIRLFKHLTNKDSTITEQLYSCISFDISPLSGKNNPFLINLHDLQSFVTANELRMLNSPKRYFELPFFSLFTYNPADGSFEDLLADEESGGGGFKKIPMLNFESSINKCRISLSSRQSNELFVHISLVHLTYQDCYSLINKYLQHQDADSEGNFDDYDNDLIDEDLGFKVYGSQFGEEGKGKFGRSNRPKYLIVPNKKVHSLFMASASLDIATTLADVFAINEQDAIATTSHGDLAKRFSALKHSILGIERLSRISVVGILRDNFNIKTISAQNLTYCLDLLNFLGSKRIDWSFSKENFQAQEDRPYSHNRLQPADAVKSERHITPNIRASNSHNRAHSIKFDRGIFEREANRFGLLQSEIKAKKLLDIDIENNLKIFEHALPDSEEMSNWQPFNDSKLDNLLEELEMRHESSEKLYSDWKFNRDKILENFSSCIDLASSLEKDNNQLEIELQVANEFKNNLEERISQLRSESLELRNEYSRLENVYKRKAYDELQGVRNELQGEYTLRRRRLRNLLNTQNHRIALLRELADTNDDKEINHLIIKSNKNNISSDNL
ncbi:MAG: hypothetical protein MHMPM18_002691 [Marteilia pararefringens]